MIEAKISQVANDISILQNYVNLNKEIGFNNSARLLEVIAIKLFKLAEIADLKNMNQIKVNFPSIDAADDLKGVAVQTTSVADTRKVNKTLAAFNKEDNNGVSLRQSYNKLYIFGFCRTAKMKDIPNYCELVGPSYFLDKLLEMNSEDKIQELIDTIRQHSEYSKIHPYDDISCLKVVLQAISRNAVKHPMHCEGNLRDMTKGLKEISELIGKGSIGKKEMSKAMHAFEDQRISTFLIYTLDKIGRIEKIVNSAALPGSDVVYLEMKDMEDIDLIKQEISKSSMEIASRYRLDIPLAMHD